MRTRISSVDDVKLAGQILACRRADYSLGQIADVFGTNRMRILRAERRADELMELLSAIEGEAQACNVREIMGEEPPKGAK